jgi:hypothetical protein
MNAKLGPFLLALSLAFSARAQESLIQNGSFEVLGGHSSDPVPPWIYDGGLLIMNGAEQTAHGRNAIGVISGLLYQDVPTTAGEEYRLSFYVAGWAPDGPLPFIHNIAVHWNGRIVGVTRFDSSGKTGTNMGWQYEEFRLLAVSATSRLGFSNPNAISNPNIPLIDNVQLVRIPPPPTVNCSAPLILECRDGSAAGVLQAEVVDTSGSTLQVVWTVNGIAAQTNTIPAGGNITRSNLTFAANFASGSHDVAITASNSGPNFATCHTTVRVLDTIPPEITRIEATPNVLWPPNRRMVAVTLRADVVDGCDPSPVFRIAQVTSNEPLNHSAPDWEITGEQTLNLRAERLGKGKGRLYTIVVQSEDLSGNISFASVEVTVPDH